ncbi:uncharacterized protein NESG_00585 [Nematocida ausubeli]|uniref:Uncharacterized protein n=1 Tax=Nematocida ausubeli (strain ATCC PRA-371 / ERTm2) TaxID=1913371 RepID=A0A086J2S2_NEMA1|nr:uncharacterized protein NESG_00585 [Nematocida ausubeli]KAI5137075.1 hypothetical protein NEAUS07_1805 [Nematocida ausubeli]KFG26440.1 hypothetical protein NESG_00585 [Nematocida ausubeli]
MTPENKIRTAAAQPPKEMYKILSAIKQEAPEEDIDYLGHKITIAGKTEKTRKSPYLLYSMIETLRIGAPHNPFTLEQVKELFKEIIHRGPKQAEDKKILEIIACYRMVSLLTDVKTINNLAELSLLNISQKWSLEMLQSIVEEKEEDLGREIKLKIAKRVAEGSSILGFFIEKYPLLFMPAVKEIILSTKKSKIEIIKRFNSLNKEVVTVAAIKQATESSKDKKEFLKFVQEASVRQEILKYVETLAEDRSQWIRCQVPKILYRKSKSTFYTSASGAVIRESAVSIWKNRLQDTSAQVRQEILKTAAHEGIRDLKEIQQAILERIRDTNRDVRKEAISVISSLAAEAIEYAQSSREKCFICRRNNSQNEIFIPLLLSIFIDDHAAQVTMIKAVLDSLAKTTSNTMVQQEIIAEIFHMVHKSPEDIEKLTGCASALVALGLSTYEEVFSCSKHSPTVDLIKKITSPGSATKQEIKLTEDTPVCLILMHLEGYSRGQIPVSFLSLLKKLSERISEALFYRIARIITVAQYSAVMQWGAPEEYKEGGYPRAYLEARQICITEGQDFSIDLSRIEENRSILGNISMDVAEQERRLFEFGGTLLLMLQMDFLECGNRSALLERTVFKYILSCKSSELPECVDWLFFKQRLVCGIRQHPDTEIRLIFSAILVLIYQRTTIVLNIKGILSLLSFLCWISVEYRQPRIVDAVQSIFHSNTEHAQEIFSFFMNLKRIKIEEDERQNEMYILSEEVTAMLVRETSKLGINSAQYSNELPDGFCEELRIRGGWATTLQLLDDDRFSSNLLTVFKPK